jgi:uncharacterized membrane protein YgdD (TMEM256/DUF423 family)
MKRNYLGIFAAISGFSAVALGAFAAHGLKSHFNEYQLSIWQTAVFYQFIHTLVLLMLVNYPVNPVLNRAKGLLAGGILLFSGSLYVLAAAQLTWLGGITPLGGLCFLFAWGHIAYYFWCEKAN